MHIAICDDDRDELLRISSILDTYRQERKASISYQAFYSATELLSTAKAGKYDLYLLDIIMPGVNGMETAQEIRSFDRDTSIVFLTSSPEYAVQSYRYKAQDYLLKPAKAGNIYPLLDTLIVKTRKPQDSLGVKTKNGMARILFEDLAYVEVVNKWVYFHLSDGSVREAAASLAEFECVLLSRPQFVRTHRSYIVNLLQIGELTGREATTLSGKKVPISRQNFIKVRDAYIEQLFSKKED